MVHYCTALNDRPIFLKNNTHWQVAHIKTVHAAALRGSGARLRGSWGPERAGKGECYQCLHLWRVAQDEMRNTSFINLHLPLLHATMCVHMVRWEIKPWQNVVACLCVWKVTERKNGCSLHGCAQNCPSPIANEMHYWERPFAGMLPAAKRDISHQRLVWWMY